MWGAGLRGSLPSMNDQPGMCFYLEPDLRKSAEAGTHNFIAKIAEVLEKARFRVEYADIPKGGGHGKSHLSLTHMSPPAGDKGLIFRRVYHYPFWQIETVSERWRWDVAKAAFDPETVDPTVAHQFYGFWQKRLFDIGPSKAVRGSYIYAPLQGRLAQHRSFQRCSPLRMLEVTLEHAAGRHVIAGLHPKETYSASELTALDHLARRDSRLSIQTGGMAQLLQDCDFVVTQNSAVAFSGYFFGKAAMLFADIDFHHIAITADMNNLSACFSAISAHRPDFAAYLWWFWQDQSINAGRPDAQAKIAARLQRFGWPV